MTRWAWLVGGLSLLISAGTAYAQQERVFFGNLHSHTRYSDGSGTPDEAFRHARDKALLDFLAITEHNHAAAESGASRDRRDGLLIATEPTLYNGPKRSSLMQSAVRHTQNGRFVGLYGQEFSSISKGNHVNVFEVSAVIDVPNGRFDQLLRTWLPQNRDSGNQLAIIQLNHPALLDNASIEYGADDFGSTAAWVAELGAHAALIEVLNGPAMARDFGNRPAEMMEVDFLQYLNLGFYLAPTADQDNHYRTWGNATDARTAVIASELTRSSILDALRSRHVYATEDKNLRIVARVNGRLMGERLTAPASADELAIELSIQDDDEFDAAYEIEVWTDRIGGTEVAKVVEMVHLEGNTLPSSPLRVEDIRYEGGAQYVFLKVIQQGEDGSNDRAWTAPVWFEPGTPEPVAPVDITGSVASRNSAVYHISLECLDAKSIRESNRLFGAEAERGRRMHRDCPRRERL